MANEKFVDINQRKIQKITIWGMVINVILSFLKIFWGAIIHSMALVADGVHSLSDLLTDVVVIVSSRAARRPPDSSHPYGHGKFETFGTQLIGIILIMVGVKIGWSALMSLYHHEQNFPGPLVLVIAFLSIVSKEALFHLTRKVAVTTRSSSLYANAWHHRSDAFSSVAVMAGGGLSLLGFGYGDQLAGLVVGLMVIGVAGSIILDSLKELSEHAVDEDTVNSIQDILETHSDVYSWHKLRTRKIGAEFFVDVHILVSPSLSVEESHQMTVEIEREIQMKIARPVNTLIHVEPFIESEREELA